MDPEFDVKLLGPSTETDGNRHLDWSVTGEELVVELPAEKPDGRDAEHAYAFEIQAVKPDESAFESAASSADESAIVRSRERMREIIERL
ncbi:hypothetical protein OB955_22545 [Halobacteria archaeon AArc-m2/3/4]|uniref:Uncharacterized protein n=1 Tax=Natronoglomus mannanivorans TaxID=2979990 RepID=A0ABT2QKQ2_9EURY|nr:hypothetical protein [Halobacteria archaeon AArc-m2/3/4]